MALSTLLEIIDRAADELGLSRPTAITASSDPQVRQMYALVNAAGRDLMRSHDWAALQSVATFGTVNGTANYDLASDYDRMISDTTWNRTTHFRAFGPDTVQLNRALREGILTSIGIHQRFRLQGSTINIWPTPTATETMAYEYISNKWARSAASAAQTEFLADTDTSLFDPDLMKAEVKWRFMSAKGMYSETFYKEAMELRNARISSDIGGTVLNLGPDNDSPWMDFRNIPDSNWGL